MQPPQPHSWKQGECPRTIKEIWTHVTALQEELFELREDNHQLRNAVNQLTMRNSRLEADLEALDQYSRRENVCFTNIKVDDDHKCDDQVVALCNELGVDVRTEDLVAAHPLPGKKSTRFIARFKDRATAQKVFQNRKQTKNIDPSKRKSILADDQRGVAVQPNITPKRSALLAQVKDAVEKKSLDSCWVDTKNCNVMLRLNKNGRPTPIKNTFDLLKYVSDYEPEEFILCVNPMNLFSVPNFSPSSNSDDTGY
jgi:FtsZ-binding cell division protein ZapB